MQVNVISLSNKLHSVLYHPSFFIRICLSFSFYFVLFEGEFLLGRLGLRF